MSKIAKNCGTKVPKTSVFDKIDYLVGNDVALATAMKLECSNLNEFDQSFIDWYKQYYKTNTAPGFSPKTKQAAEKVANAVFDYYYFKHPSVNATINTKVMDDNSAAFGYSSTLTREEGKMHISTFILDEFNRVSNNNISIPGNKRQYYLNKIREAWLNNIINTSAIRLNRDRNELMEEYNNAEDKTSYIENLLGGEDMSITNKNLYAVYKEINASDATVNNYLNELFNNNKLQYVLAQVKNDLEAETVRLAAEANRDDGENRDVENNEDLDDTDVSIITLNNHIGVYSSFMTHVGPRIKNYFNTLRKLATPELENYDTANTYGIAEAMDANACCSMIYNNADTSNLPNFIKSIRRIGETVKGFEAFVQFAYDLENNLDFATEILTVFGKAVVSKFEIDHENGTTKCRISNTTADARSVMNYNMLNDIRSSIEDISTSRYYDKYNKLVGAVNSKSFINLSDEDKQKKLDILISDLTGFIRGFFPSISEVSIKSYIQLNNNAGGNLDVQLSNIKSLLPILNGILKKEEDVKRNFNEIKAEHNRIVEENARVTKSKGWKESDAYLKQNSAAYTDYTQPINSVVQSLTDKLLPYSIVDVSFNSRNIYGNNNSDVINMSWCMRISEMMKQNRTETITDKKGITQTVIRNEALENWGKDLFRSNQYNNSNLLLEHRDENGNIINYGIFKYVGDSLCITDYAKSIIDIELFNGSSDLDKGANVSYSDMTSGDYLPSSYMAFFRTTKTDAIGDFNGQLGTYFLRTPSDAPKQFGIRAPRYNCDNLFVFTPEDEAAYNASKKALIESTLNYISWEDYKNIYASEGSRVPFDKISKISDKYLKEYLMPNHNIMVRDNRFVKPIDEEGNVYYTVVTTSGSIFVLQGEYVEAGNGHALKDAKLVGEVSGHFVNKEQIDKTPGTELYNFYDNYYGEQLLRNDVELNGVTYKQAKKTINKQHPVFKMMINHFKQEMIDAATALNHYFVMEQNEDGTYHVQLNSEHKPTFKEGRDNKTGFKFYHLNDKGEVLTEIDGGVRLDGAVFGSNKFTLVTERVNDDGSITVEKTNYLDNIISRRPIGSNTLSELGVAEDDGSINLLYGGGMRIVMSTNSNGNLVPSDVIFSDAQQARVEEAMSNFIEDYIAQVTEAVIAREDFIQGVDVKASDIQEYAMNQRLIHYTYDELFEGNSKFYKDSQTLLKRAKEYQGSGVPYGIVDYLTMFDGQIKDIPDDSSYLNNGYISEPEKEQYVDDKGKTRTRTKLDDDGKVVMKDTKIQDLFKGTILEGTRQRSGFNGVTIKNTISTNFEALKELKTVLIKQGLDENDVNDILYGRVVLDKNGNPKYKDGQTVRRGGFTDTKVNDAQSYITVQEWVRRIFARGQGQRYLPLIRKLIDPNYKLSKEDIKEFIQVQKNFYFDNAYNEKYGIHAPRQIKNAEFVLVPQLIQGTQLEQVYDLMREAGIDQLNTVETSKASNETLLTLWDENGNISAERLENFVKEAKDNMQVYDYAFLYTQQETPQHMAAENKAGIQFTKKLIDNIDSNNSLYGLKEEFFKLMSANITDSFETVLEELNVPRDKNGNIIFDSYGNIEGVDMKVLYSRLEEELRRTGMDNNSAAFVTIKPGDLRPEMPSYINNYITKFESLFQSLFNNSITRQKLPGFHAPQITNVGWKSMGDDLANVSEDKLKNKEIYSRFVAWINNKKATDENFKGEIKFSKKKLTADSKKLFKEFINETMPSYAKKLAYHPKVDGKVQGYIEVVLPYSYLGIDKNSTHYKNMSDEEILKELNESGKLDEVIGYRIPTEGKQSICNMKVVGFIDDMYGSTIIVPDDWVSQTGSDFDVDSVYGIQYSTYKDKDGQIHKIEYKSTLTEWDYFNYVRRFGEREIDTKVNDKIAWGINRVKEEFEKIYNQFHDREEELWNELPDVVQKAIKDANIKLTKRINNMELSKKDAYVYRLGELSKIYKDIASKYAEKNKALADTCNKLAIISEDIQDYLTNYNDYFSSNKSTVISSILQERLNSIENIAKEVGLVDFDKFKSNSLKYNTRAARNNRILEVAQTILNDPSTYEETLYRSNFEDLVYERNQVMNDNVTKSRIFRSPYNVLDQIAYQEEAMSGAKLKAMSVSLDTFCSVCNTVKPTLSEPITVVYEDDKVSFDNVSESYNAEHNKDNKTITIHHDTYGWSRNNRNTANKLITAYSSETTAFILDAIKEGSLPNVNEYTFAAFKTLANLGVDYRASLSFIMSPAVTEIVNANNNNNSVFSRTTGNPIHQAIRAIAQNLDVKATSTTPIVAIINQINANYGEEMKKMFGIDGDFKISLKFEEAAKIPIDVKKLVDRIKEQGEFGTSTPVEKKALFDLANVLIFNRLNNIARQLGDVARCCNPDKFGAKQSVYATRQVFKNIDNILFSTESIPVSTEINDEAYIEVIRTPKPPILTVGDKHILEAIYPGVSESNGDVDNMIKELLSKDRSSESKHPILYSHLRCSSALSTLVAKSVLETENPVFTKLLDGLVETFNGAHPQLSEETYVDFKKYVLAALYKDVRCIKFPITTRVVNGDIELTIEDGAETETNPIEITNIETARIYGYEHPQSLQQTILEEKTIVNDSGTTTRVIRKQVPFEIEDLNNPTDAELEVFEEFSPAQKVQFIKKNFSDAGIFQYLKVNLDNRRRGRYAGMQTIEFVEQNLNSNILYAEFEKAFYNTNPLIVSAAIDLVKYAVQVEGMQMSATAINKVISNKVLIGDFGANGLGFTEELRTNMNKIGTIDSPFSTAKEKEVLYENYLRSHPETAGIKTLYLTEKKKRQLCIEKPVYGTYMFLKPNNKKDDESNTNAYFNILESAGIIYYQGVEQIPTPNKYIRIKDNKGNRLYKIIYTPNYVFLYPLGNLQRNENSEWSGNEDNNEKILSKETCERLASIYATQYRNSAFDYEWVKNKIDEFKNSDNPIDIYYKKRRETYPEKEAKEFNWNSDYIYKEGLRTARTQAEDYFAETPEGKLYIRNLALGDYISTKGPKYGSSQTLYLKDGNNVKVRVYLSPKNGNTLVGLDPDIIPDYNLRRIAKDMIARREEKLSEVYEVVPEYDIDEANASDVEELSEERVMDSEFVRDMSTYHSNVMEYMNNRVDRYGDDDSRLRLHRLNMRGVTAKTETISKHIDFTTNEIAAYSNNLANYIKNLFEKFIPDENEVNGYISITDPRVRELIKTDKNLRNKYLMACNIATDFISIFSPYTELNAQGETLDTRTRLESIKKDIESIRNLPLKQVQNAFNNAIAEQLATNPLIKEDVIDIMAGYWRSYGAMWKFNDIMENGTPLLQVTLKDVMGDIEAKKKWGEVEKKRFLNKLKDIERTAASRGETINYDKFIDKDGRIMRDYSPELVEVDDKLRTARNDAAKEFGYGSIQHLRAKLEYDEFKAKHYNQEAKPEYYRKKCKMARVMIEQYPKLFEHYSKLIYERAELYRLKDIDGLSDDKQKRLDDINNEIKNLTRIGYYYDAAGNRKMRPSKNNPTASYITPDEAIIFGIDDNNTTAPTQEELDLYSTESSNILSKYIADLSTLENEYYKYDEDFGFRQKLKDVNKTIVAYEKPDANGIPTVPQSELDKIPAYKEAIKWRNENARKEFIPNINPSTGEDVGLQAKLKKAFEVLKRRGNNKNARINEICREHNQGQGIYDAERIPDGRMLSDAEIDAIKEIEEANYGLTGMPPFTDRILISSGKADRRVYKDEFYKKLRKTNNSKDSAKYFKLVTELNSILDKYYNQLDGLVHFEMIPDTNEGIEELERIGDLYQQIRLLKHDTKDETSSEFIKEEVEFTINRDAFEAAKTNLVGKTRDYQIALKKILYARRDNGDPLWKKNEDGTKVIQANSLLFGIAKPIDEEKWIDREREEALNLVEQVYVRKPTKYYEQARIDAMRNNHNGSYNEWYRRNHIYNPYTRQIEPLACWVNYEINEDLIDNGEFTAEWIPTGKSRVRTIRDGNETITVNGEQIQDPTAVDMRNPDYDPNKSLKENYHKGSDGGKYDNPIELNQSEKEVRDLFYNELINLATVDKARRHFEKGYMPIMRRNNEKAFVTAGKEAFKMLGIDISSHQINNEWTNAIGHEHGVVGDVPMTKILKNKQSIDYEKKISELEKELAGLDKVHFTNEQEKEKRQKEIEEKIKYYNDEIQNINNALMNRDWKEVMSAYITQMARFNAVQDNVENLYHLLNMLRQTKMYTTSKKSTGRLKQDKNKTTKENPVYEEVVDKNLIEQYENFIRRLVFDQWKEDNSKVKVANAIQGFTSANYMMLNLKGGVANVTLGETGILAEAAAKEYFGKKDWAFGTLEWNKGIIGFARRGFHMDLGEDICFNKQDAIVKFFNVVDYDEKGGLVRELPLESRLKKLRDAMFSPQNIGEHYMQNSVLFAMLHCHKLVTMSNGEVTYMNEFNYRNYRNAEVLNSVLTEEQKAKFEAFKKEVKSDKNVLKDYAWFRKDLVSDFIVLHCSKEERKAYTEKIEKEHKKIKEDFDKLENLYDQLLFEDGELKFKEGSDLYKLNEELDREGSDMTKAYALLGRFTEKVRKVNNKIHGVYNKDGRAYIESKWYGALIMQYHKHLPMGLIKHYMRRGHWNEFRESVDKGRLESLVDLHRLNLRAVKVDAGLTDDQQGALEGFIFLLTHIGSYLGNLRMTFNLMPEYDKNNCNRRLGEYIGVAAALLTVAALWGLADDDDEIKDESWFNFALYEADRLASECFMYNPVGFMAEGKKLMSSPIAAKSIIDDGFKTVGLLADWLFDDEYDPYYHSGRFAGQHKLTVYIKRRIPIWSAINNHLGLSTSNHYYKLGENPIGLFNIKEAVTK